MKLILILSLFLTYSITQVYCLIGLHLGLSLKLPNLNLGTNASQLINPLLSLHLSGKPMSEGEKNSTCGASGQGHHKNGLVSGTRWYQNGARWYIPIVMDPAFTSTERDVIISGMTEIQQKTCMDFYVYRSESELAGSDFVYVSRAADKGCWSWIGRQRTGRQDLKLPPGCIYHRTAMHELMHAIGFYHQHVVPDRDNYVNIYLQNVQSGQSYNFDKQTSSVVTSYGTPYDFYSVMHYRRDEFSSNGWATIAPKQDIEIGLKTMLSYYDIYKINAMHGCPH